MSPSRNQLVKTINRLCYKQFYIGTISFDVHHINAKKETCFLLMDERFMFTTGWDVNIHAIFLG